MPVVTLARNAMATRFELVLHGEDEVRLRAAGEEALDEIERLEARLSLYRPGSEIAGVNARAAREEVRVSPAVFKLLQTARQLHEESGGAFDITVGPLVRAWGFMGGGGHAPDPAELDQARACVGMNLLELNPDDFTVRFAREGVMIDLGAIGKGYALDCAVELLREAGVARALFHGGTSTVCAIGRPLDTDRWKIAIDRPGQFKAADNKPLAVVPLENEALSVSAVWGKSFERDGQTYGHVLDPRTGAPTQGSLLAAVVLPSATETDALSTALLTLGESGHDSIAKLRPGIRTLLVSGPGGIRVESRNLSLVQS